MKIAHVTATFPPYFGGTGNVAFQNARSLAHLGHRVTVYTASLRAQPGAEVNEVTVRRLRALLRIGNAPLLPGLLRLERHDIVHLHYPFIFGAEMVLALKRLRGQPYLLTYHNDLASPGVKGRLFAMYDWVWARRVMENAARIIVTSWDGAAASPILRPFMESDPDRFREIPNGVDLSRFTPQDGSAVRARLNLGDSQRVILFVGSMDSAHHPKGGVPVLLEAMVRLQDVDISLLLVGDGDRVEDYRRMARDHGLGPRVRFLGKITNQELPPIFAAADLVVQPSQMFEPFGLVAVEAMACSKPVVVSDLPGVRRVVSEAGGGVLARPGDADDLAEKIRMLLADPSLREKLGSKGRSGVEERYDWGSIGPLLEATYREALASS